MTQPELPTQPLRSIILTEEQSEILTAAAKPGEAFIVLGRGSWPECPGRWRMHILPASVRQVDGAIQRIRTTQAKEK
jgi:hypothetical protein|tara:strand:- start:649 stop:879 length:231 start_codon:yes stop_codon:yes gene_type:complete